MMKMLTKILATLTTAAMMAGTVAMLPASAETIQPMKGDITEDGCVDIIDGACILTYYGYQLLGKEMPEQRMAFKFRDNITPEIADINSDNTVDVADAVFILRYYANALVHHAPDGSFMSIDEFYADGFDSASLKKAVALYRENLERDIQDPSFDE